MSKFVIACGGTGGHLSPGIALAQELSARGHQCTLIITNKNVDKRLAQFYTDLNFISLQASTWSKKFWQWPKFFYIQIKNFLRSLRLLKEKSADLTIGFGGLMNVGVILASALLKKPCVLHEANQCPGRAVRLLSYLAKRIYLPEGVNLTKISAKTVRNLGFPIRKDIQKIDKWAAREQLNVPKDQRLLVVIGGSQGAKVFNRWVIENFAKLGSHNINVICVTGIGRSNKGEIEESYKDGRSAKLIFMPFVLNMNVLYSAADLVIGRAGAGTIAELTRCETPSILVPYPFAADNHQYKNALYHERRGSCLLVEQTAIDRLIDETLHLITDDCLLEDMRYNMQQLNHENAVVLIANDLEQLLKNLRQTSSKRRKPSKRPTRR